MAFGADWAHHICTGHGLNAQVAAECLIAEDGEYRCQISPARRYPCTTPESDSRQLIAADLRSLIGRIEGGIRLIDAAMELDNDGSVWMSRDILTLDDVAPRCAIATVALNACRIPATRPIVRSTADGPPL